MSPLQLLSLSQSSVTFQILPLCSQLLSFPHLGFCHISVSHLWYLLFHCLLPAIWFVALVHFKQQCLSVFLPLSQTTATLLIACFLFDEQVYGNVSWYTRLYFTSVYSSVPCAQVFTSTALLRWCWSLNQWSSSLFSFSSLFSIQYHWAPVLSWSTTFGFKGMDLLVSSPIFLFSLCVRSASSIGQVW